MSVLLVHEALCTQKEFDDLCRTFDEQNVDAFIFLTPTDVMFSAACRAQVNRPRVLITSTHGGMGVQEELRLLRPADRRKIALVGIDHPLPLMAVAASSVGSRMVFPSGTP